MDSLLDWVQNRDMENRVSSSMDIDWNNNDSLARNVVVVLDNCTLVVVAAGAGAGVAVAFDMHRDIVD